MSIFGNWSEGGVMDVIRCDETEYLVWKWRPSGDAVSTRKENAIRWGSSLRVKDGEVAVFLYKQESGSSQDFIEGPFDETIKTANFPVLANIIGLAYAGQSPFQAEVYFINLAGNIRIQFRTPWFLVADPRFLDFPVNVAAEGSFRFNITDYKSFIRLYRLTNFEIEQFSDKVRDVVLRYVKGIIVNVPADHGIPVLQIERKLLEINDLIAPRVRLALEEQFGVNLQGFDLRTVESNKEDPHYKELRSVTADLEVGMRQAQNAINIRNLQDTQAINAENISETLRIQREQAERLARLQTEQQFLGAHQIDQQTRVLTAAADNLGSMGQMNLSGGGGNGGGFNPVGMMTGLAVGGVMGGQMAGMMNSAGQNIQQSFMTPPPPPTVAYYVLMNGQNSGPFNQDQLQQMVVAGRLNRIDYVWKQGMANWELAGNVEELKPMFAQHCPPPPPPRVMSQEPNMNSDNFFSIDRLVEFGLGIGVAQQMVSSMNHALQNTYIPGTMNPMAPSKLPSAFYVILDGKQAGPFNEDELSRLLVQGTVTRATNVWKAGMAKWEQAENVPEVLRLVALCPPPFKPDD